MRTLKLAPLFVICATALCVPFAACAQQSSFSGQEAPVPPKLEKLEEGEPPAITIRPSKGQKSVTEKRAPGGQVKEIKVTNGSNTYYVKPPLTAGSALPGDAQSPQSRPAQWEVYEFNKNKKPKDGEAADAPQPPVLTPAPTPAK